MKFTKFCIFLLCSALSVSLYPMYWGSLDDYDYGRMVSPELQAGFDCDKRTYFNKKSSPALLCGFTKDRIFECLLRKGDLKKAANFSIGRRILEEYHEGLNLLKSSNINAASCFEYVLQQAPAFLRKSDTHKHIFALKDSLKLYAESINDQDPNAVKKCVQLALFYRDASDYRDASEDPNHDLVKDWLKKALFYSRGDVQSCYDFACKHDLDLILDSLCGYRDPLVLRGLYALEKKQFDLAQTNFKEAAERNNGYAQCHMAALGLRGVIGGMSTYEGSFWLNKLLKHEDGLQFIPYFKSFCGDGMEVVLKKAIQGQDDMHARFVYGVRLYAEKKWDEALEYLRPVADQGDEVSRFYVANILRNNTQSSESVLEAIAYYKSLLKPDTVSHIKKESSAVLKQLFDQGVNEALIPFFEVGLYDGPMCAEALKLFCVLFKNDGKGLQLWPFLDCLCDQAISKNYTGNSCATSLLACLYSVKVLKEQDLAQKEMFATRVFEYLDMSRDMFGQKGIEEAIAHRMHVELAHAYSEKGDFAKAYEHYIKITSNSCGYYHVIKRSILELFGPEVVKAFNISVTDAAQAIERLKTCAQKEDILPEERMMSLSTLGQIYSGTSKFPSGLRVKADPGLAYRYLNEVITSGDQHMSYYKNAQYFLSKLIFDYGEDVDIANGDKCAYDLRLQAFKKGMEKQDGDFLEMGVLAYRLGRFSESMRWFKNQPDSPISQFYTAQFNFMAKNSHYTKRNKSLVEFEQLFKRLDVDFELLFTNYSDPALLKELLERQKNDEKVRTIFTKVACFNNAEWAKTYKQQAFEIVQRDARAGLSYAQTMLGYLYHNGKIVEASPDQTCKWFKKVFFNEKSSREEKNEAVLVLMGYMRKSLPDNITPEQFSLGYCMVNFLLDNGYVAVGLTVFNDLEALLFNSCKSKEMLNVLNCFGILQKIRNVALAGNEDAKIVYADCALMRDLLGGADLRGDNRQEKLKELIKLLKETKWTKKGAALGKAHIFLVCDCLQKDDYQGVVENCEQALLYDLKEQKDAIKYRLATTYLTHGKKGLSGAKSVSAGVKLLKELAEVNFHKAQVDLVKLYSPNVGYLLVRGGTIKKNQSLADKYAKAAAVTQVEQQVINPELEQKTKNSEKEYLDIALNQVPELNALVNRSIPFRIPSIREKFAYQLEKAANPIVTKCDELVETGYVPALVALANVNLCKASITLCNNKPDETKSYIVQAIGKLFKFVSAAYTDGGTYKYNVEAGFFDAFKLLRAFVKETCKDDKSIQNIYGALLARMREKKFVIIELNEIKPSEPRM